mgnify:CR=1 FL=1
MIFLLNKYLIDQWNFSDTQEKCEFKEGTQCLKWFKDGFEKVDCAEIECVKMPYVKGG